MKSARRHFQLLRSQTFSSSSSSCPPLTDQQLAQTNLLLRRLCNTGHLDAATDLAAAALLANPPPSSLSLSPLLESLASLPGTSRPISLLSRLRRAPPSHHRHVSPAAAVLAASYFSDSRPADALRLFRWLAGPGSPFSVDAELGGVFVAGFFRNEMVFECLKVLRAIAASASEGFRCGGAGELVCRALLREARVREAVELREALEGNDLKKVSLVLDRMIEDWTE